MDERYRDLFTAAWRVSVDAKEKVRGKGAEMFGKDAVWLRSFDFQKPVKDYHHIRGFRFLNDNGMTRMFVLKHDGSFMQLTEKPDEKFINAMMSELALAKTNPKRTCEWYDSEKAAIEECGLNRETIPNCRNKITEVCPGFFFVHYDDFSAGMKNSSGQRLETPLGKHEFIVDFQYAGKMDGKEHFAYEAVTEYHGERVYGLFDVNGDSVHFPHINEYENQGKLVSAVCKSFQEMVKEQERQAAEKESQSERHGLRM